MTPAPRNRLRALHRLSAAAIGAFIALHLANHLAVLGGQDAHVAIMDALRPLYRQPLIEAALLAALVWQIGSGAVMVIRGWRDRRGIVGWAQALSGLYLAAFLVIHVSAVLAGRAQGLDTDFSFAAAGIHAGYAWFFVPYYALAVIAVSVHVACAAYWLLPRWPLVAKGIALAGLIAAAVIVAGLAGLLFPVDIAPEYLAGFGQ